MNEKIRKLEKELESVDGDRENYITFKHFEDVINPVRHTLDSLQKDIKQLLTILANRPHVRGG